MTKTVLHSGKGLEAEVSCVVRGQPRPRVVWYREGKVVDLAGKSHQALIILFDHFHLRQI